MDVAGILAIESRNGRPARWDGAILDLIVNRIEALGAQAGEDGFAATDWSQRNFVKISGSGKSKISFPFFHALTSSEWVVTLRFFVPKSTFRPNILEKQLTWPPFMKANRPSFATSPG